MSNIKRIGILTGGGDCPGLNAVIRGIGKTAIHQFGLEVMGVRDGFAGLIEDRVEPLDFARLSGILTRGGTILGTNNRSNPTHYCESRDDEGNLVYVNAVDRCAATIERHGIDILFVVGGDGTFTCAESLVDCGVPCVGVPKTIDNDIYGTDLTVGYASAARIGTMALDRLHSTADSHHRVMVCELMGRNAGWLTLACGLASGSDVILIPEIPFDMDVLCRFVEERRDGAAGFSIVACAEGARPIDGTQVIDRVDETSPDPIRLGGIGRQVANAIEQRTGIETRTTVLGHVQRGGEPASSDRVLAMTFATRAVALAMEGGVNQMVVLRDGHVATQPIADAANRQRLVPPENGFLRAARAVRTCFGDEA